MSRVRTTVAIATSVIALCLVARVDAQQRPGPLRAPPPVPRAAAPIDLTGYWVSIVTQDWRWRMVTPRKGDYEGVPLTPEARAIADAWDPAQDEAARRAVPILRRTRVDDRAGPAAHHLG